MPQPTPSDLQTAISLWSFLQPPNEREYLRYFAKHPTKRVQGGIIKSAEHLARLMAGFRASGHDAYIQLNPSTTAAGLRPTKAEVARHSFLLYDMDPLTETVLQNPWPFLSWDLPPPGAAMPLASIRIYSGRGYQVWAAGTGKRMDTAEQRRQAEWYNTRILEGLSPAPDWRLDILPDLTRLARMPNTINSKTGREAQLLTTIAIGAHKYVDWNACMEWAGPMPVYEPPTIVPSGKWQMALSSLSLTAKTFILEGAESGARHRNAYAAAAALRDAAIPQESALTAVLRGARLSRPTLDSDNSFTTKEVERIVRRVYGN